MTRTVYRTAVTRILGPMSAKIVTARVQGKVLKLIEHYNFTYLLRRFNKFYFYRCIFSKKRANSSHRINLILNFARSMIKIKQEIKR